MSKTSAGSDLHSASNSFREASASNVPVRMAFTSVFNFREIEGTCIFHSALTTLTADGGLTGTASCSIITAQSSTSFWNAGSSRLSISQAFERSVK